MAPVVEDQPIAMAYFPDSSGVDIKRRKLVQTKRWITVTLLLTVLGVLGTHFFDRWHEQKNHGTEPDIVSGPWGVVQTWDIHLEQPLEYVGFEKASAEGPSWNFGLVSPESLPGLLQSCGLGTEQTDRLMAGKVINTSGEIVLKPDEQTLISLDPDVRSKLYLILSKIPSNRFQANPYFIPQGNVAALFKGDEVSASAAVSLMKGLLYTRNGYTYFSDPEVVLRRLASKEDSLAFLKALTSQKSVMMQLLIRHNSDIDKPLNYWGLSCPGVMLKDLRPLLESQQRLPEGGAISILYLLPPLAREKLFKSPMPPSDSRSVLPDCHWSALNFFNATPDPRLSDNDYASRFILANYYEVAKPGVCGDLVLLVDAQNNVIHSSVYIADDIVFTKNGSNYAQPWILMHENDMVGSFSAKAPVHVAYFRRKGI